MPYEVFTIEVSRLNKHLTLAITLFMDCRHFFMRFNGEVYLRKAFYAT